MERDLRIYIESLGGNLYHFRDNITGLEVSDGNYAVVEIKLGSNQIEEATKNYIEKDGLYPEEEMHLTLTELLKLNVIETNVVKDKTCQGYVDIKNDEQFFDYEAYIKCGNYETKNLDKKKLDD